MNCPHCGKVVKLVKDSNVGQEQSDEGTGDLGELLDAIQPASLDGKSLEFYEQTKARYEQYNDKTRMSPKQMKWLRELAQGGSEDKW